MPAAELEARLDERFAILTGGSRAALPRQQTLRAMVDWSWELLNPAEQAVLARLSVFAGGFGLAVAEAVAAGEDVPAGEILGHLGALVDKSLVQFDHAGSGPGRYRLLQFWLGTARAGQQVTVWMDTTTVHLSVGGWRIKTVPSRLSEVDLARLRHADARPAGPPPAGPSPGALAASRCVEVDRLVTGIGGVTMLNRLILVGSPLAGQRARIRLDGELMHVITQDGMLWRTLPCPIPPGQRHRLQGVRLAGPAPLPQAAAVVQRRVSSRGGIQVARQRIQVGMTHAGKIVTVLSEDNSFRLVIGGETVAVVPRTTGREIDRYKAHATRPGRR